MLVFRGRGSQRVQEKATFPFPGPLPLPAFSHAITELIKALV